jgi:AcrR family transcriptional regulator
MGRRAVFTEEAILDAMLAQLAEGGAATVAGVAARLGAPSGSVYHRFGSRDLLMARLWIRTVRRFQRGFIEALEATNLDGAALAAMVHTLRWTREHPAEARLLSLYRRDELMAGWPDDLGPELADLNRSATEALKAYAKRRYPRVRGGEAVRFALVGIPYAAVREHLTKGTLPTRTDEELVVIAGMAILRSLDDSG